MKKNISAIKISLLILLVILTLLDFIFKHQLFKCLIPLVLTLLFMLLAYSSLTSKGNSKRRIMVTVALCFMSVICIILTIIQIILLIK